jgi:hypothetical protein
MSRRLKSSPKDKGSGSGLARQKYCKNHRAKTGYYHAILLAPNPAAKLRRRLAEVHLRKPRSYQNVSRETFLSDPRAQPDNSFAVWECSKTSEVPETAAARHAHASGPAPRSDAAPETLFPDLRAALRRRRI